MGAGSHRPSGSQRVREVQRRLRGLGYRPGPIDGNFGTRTRAAVGWFQVKHGFQVDGRATLAVVRHLRARTRPGAGRSGVEERRVAERPWEAYRELAQWTPSIGLSERDTTPGWLIPAGLALVAFAIGFAAVALLQRKGPAAEPALARALPVPRRVRALGYVREAKRARLVVLNADPGTRKRTRRWSGRHPRVPTTGPADRKGGHDG